MPAGPPSAGEPGPWAYGAGLDEATMVIPALGVPRAPGGAEDWDDATVVIRRSDLEAAGVLDRGAGRPEPPRRTEPSLGRASRTMAIATAASRLTGFLRSLAIAAAIGMVLVGDAYNTANTLPNIVYELLLGGVLTSVVVPLLVHAQERDPDGGEAYTQRLLSITTVALAVATVIATATAPLLALAYAGGGGAEKVHLTTVFAYLLLPEIFFYGLGAMLGAVLNTRGVFGPPTWTPVLNNLVVIGVAGLFLVVTRGDGLPTPASLGTGEILLLGLGTTLGIVVQAVALFPALRRSGFRWRWRLDARGARLGEAGGLALWVLGYVAVSQVGYLVQLRLANGTGEGNPGSAVFTNASLLFQMPYGILGVSLLTALMPRMSRAAVRGDRDSVVADLSLGSRLSALALLPITALFVVLGPAIGVLVYGHGRSGVDSARQVGLVLAFSAFGLVPFALTMLQLRVFYAVKDARTPTLINVGMVAAKIALCLLAATMLPDRHLVVGLAVATSVSYVVGTVLGEVLLRRRFGRLGTGRVVRSIVRFCVLSLPAGLAAWAVLALASRTLGTGPTGSAVAVVAGSLVALGVLAGATLLTRSGELDDLMAGLRGRAPARAAGTGRTSGRHRPDARP
ncbi:MAG TPA: murein biosynthesis integral membrane protein MurJ [Mycobacteriales bacterium]